MAPGLKLTGTGTYNTSYTILRAHAAAYRLYDERYRPKYSGKVGISLGKSCEGFLILFSLCKLSFFTQIITEVSFILVQGARAYIRGDFATP